MRIHGVDNLHLPVPVRPLPSLLCSVAWEADLLSCIYELPCSLASL